jgi:copper(I)-binding protein
MLPRKFLRFFVTTVLAGLGFAATANSSRLGDIDIGHPYARPTRAGQQVVAGYLTLTNKGAPDRLLSVTSAMAASVEMHSMAMEGDVMRMRQVEGIALPAGAAVALKPGALHLMLFGLKAPLKAGDHFPMTLKFEKAGVVVVTVSVEDPGPADAAAAHAH